MNKFPNLRGLEHDTFQSPKADFFIPPSSVRPFGAEASCDGIFGAGAASIVAGCPLARESNKGQLGGGFKYFLFLFSPLLGEDSHFD